MSETHVAVPFQTRFPVYTGVAVRNSRGSQEDSIVALKIDSYGVNVFPAVEQVDAKPIEDGGYEVILFTRIEGQLKPVIIRLTDTQARGLSKLLTFGGGE